MSTLSEKVSANVATIESKTNQTTPALDASFNEVLATILAVLQQSIEKVCDKATLQNLVKTATLRENGGNLNDIGEERGISYKSSGSAILNVQIAAEDGTEITPLYTLSGDDNGLDYLILSSYTASSGYITFPITCVQPGTGGNLSAGDTLTLSAPLSGAESTATVVSVATAGTEAEGIDSYRERILDDIRNPGSAGNLSFYRKRGRNASGVEEIYPYRGYLVGSTFTLPGDVSVYVEATTDINEDGIPTQTVLDAAEAAIQYDSTGEIDEMNTTVRALHVLPIYRNSVFFNISGLSVFDDDELEDCKTDIEEALAAELLLYKNFITGLDYSKDKKNVLTVPALSNVVNNVVQGYAGHFSGLIFGMSSASESSNSYTLQPGEKVKFGAATYD